MLRVLKHRKRKLCQGSSGHRAGTAARELCQRSCLPCQELMLQAMQRRNEAKTQHSLEVSVREQMVFQQLRNRKKPMPLGARNSARAEVWESQDGFLKGGTAELIRIGAKWQHWGP